MPVVGFCVARRPHRQRAYKPKPAAFSTISRRSSVGTNSGMPPRGGLPEGCSRACVSDFKTVGVAVVSRQLCFNPIDISAAGICRGHNVDKVRSGATKLDE